jgi:hypothetical protein
LWLIEANVFQLPQLHKHLNVSGYFKMTCRNFTIVILNLLLLTNCSSSDDNKKLTEARFKRTSKNNRLTGEWIYNFPFFYSKLTLREDGTFKFHDQGHYGQNYTEGKWIENDNGVVLTSNESFISKIVPKRKITNKQNSNLRPTKVPAPADLPGPHDTIRVYFNRVAFYLNNDTLTSVGNNATNNSYQFVRKKNYR